MASRVQVSFCVNKCRFRLPADPPATAPVDGTGVQAWTAVIQQRTLRHTIAIHTGFPKKDLMRIHRIIIWKATL
jgi:hypothetical protein